MFYYLFPAVFFVRYFISFSSHYLNSTVRVFRLNTEEYNFNEDIVFGENVIKNRVNFILNRELLILIRKSNAKVFKYS